MIYDLWAMVVSNPIGLIAFSVFLIIVVFTRYSKNRTSLTMKLVFISMAITTLAGGMFVSYIQSNNLKTSEKLMSNVKGNNNEVDVKMGTVGKNLKAEGDVNIELKTKVVTGVDGDDNKSNTQVGTIGNNVTLKKGGEIKVDGKITNTSKGNKNNTDVKVGTIGDGVKATGKIKINVKAGSVENKVSGDGTKSDVKMGVIE